MENHIREGHKTAGSPNKTYRDELAGKGSTFSDTPSEADARDKAKIEKVLSGDTQKIDTVHPDELKDDGDDEAIRRETLENK